MKARRLGRAFVSTESSSSWNDEGLSPPPAVKSKACWAFGRASFTTTILALVDIATVHVMSSPGARSMSETGEPLEQSPSS